MFVQRKTTELYQNLHNSLVQWQIFSPSDGTKEKPFFILLIHPHCMWTSKLCSEAFTNQHIVDVLHKHFTPCLLDEHTDPELYTLMNQSLRFFLKEQNIRPGCLFTKSTGEAFFGGGYHPPSPRYGMPSFIQFLHHAIRLINTDSDINRVLLRNNTPPKTPISWCYSWEEKIDTGYEEAFDFMNHGFGFAPKYLNIARLNAWYSYPSRKKTVQKTVERIICSPTFDPINGSVYRKCEDAIWELPVREAYLDDQAEFISLMVQTHPNTPCISLLFHHIHKQYALDNGLYAHSISYNPPREYSIQAVKWIEDTPHCSTFPSEEDCKELYDTTPNISSIDPRAICSSNAKLLRSLVQHYQKGRTGVAQIDVKSLENAIWKYFGWEEKKEWFHTTAQQMPATGLDLAIVIQAVLTVQHWNPQEDRLKKIYELVEYWEDNYLENNLCYIHPKKRFFTRGVDLVADTYASTQEEAAYTLSLLQNWSIPTKNQARDFIQNQQWVLYKTPKILSTALFAWKQIPLPTLKEYTGRKTILAFHVHRPCSHQFLNHLQKTNVIIWAQCKNSQQYLINNGHLGTIIKPVNWDLCNHRSQLHTGPLDPKDMEIFFGHSQTKLSETKNRAFSYEKATYIQSTYSVKSIDGTVVLTSSSPIICFCFYEDTYWWITKGKLHSSTSDTPHKLPPPLINPISICEHQGSILIAQREDLWLFHSSNERFGRYAGRIGTAPKDGPVYTAVFQNITSIYAYENYVLLGDAYTLRIINTQTHIVHTLEDHPPFSYAASIIMFNKHIYIADSIQTCIWQYSLEQEQTKRWTCDTPKSLHIHNDTLWVLCHDQLIEITNDDF